MSLSDWRTHWQRSFHYLDVLRGTRDRRLWPRRIRGRFEFGGRRVLVVRRDRFGDMMCSVPFLGRLIASGAWMKVLASDRIARDLLSSVGLSCFAAPEEARDWDPHLVLFLESCRHLRSTRHPERWQYVERVLEKFHDVPFSIPTMRRAESMSYHAGPYCRPFREVTALSLLEGFGTGLGLPASGVRLFERWIKSRDLRSSGRVVLNLSAGPAGSSGRRYLPMRFWADLHDRLVSLAPLACIVQPGDDDRHEEYEQLRTAGRLADCELHSSEVVTATAWLGQQRMVISPETGLCHLARNLEVPMVVMTPPQRAQFWYPPGPTVRRVCAPRLDEVEVDACEAAASELLQVAT